MDVKQVIHYLLVLVLLSVIFFGSKGGEVTDELWQLERSVEKNPEAVIAQLDSIRQENQLSKQQEAIWYLLYVTANDCLGVTHTSDLLIQRAIHYFDAEALSNRQVEAYYMAGQVYQDLNDVRKAQEYLLKAYKIAVDNEYYYSLARVCSSLGRLYTSQQMYSLALHFQQEAADYFLSQNDTVSLAAINRDIEQIHQYVTDRITDAEVLAQIQHAFDYRELEKRKEYYQQESIRKTNKLYKYYMGGFTVLLVIIIFSIYYWNKKNRREAQLNQSLRLKEQQYLASQHYLAEREAVISRLEQLHEESKTHAFFSSDLYRGVSTEWKKLDREQWQEVIKVIDHVLYKDFTGKIRLLYPRISPIDLDMCCLVKLQIPVGRIAVLLSVNSQAISNKRKRLYEKLTQENGSAQDFDRFIRNF